MSQLRILVTGSRLWTDRTTIYLAIVGALSRHISTGPAVLIHGGARGADMVAHDVWMQLRSGRTERLAIPEVYDANWDAYGKAAGHIRNKQMVATGATVCLAFLKGESKGTRGCVELARRAGIQVISYEE